MVYSTKVQCQTSDLRPMRDFAWEVLLKYQVPEKEANLIVLALDEVCANRMIHSHNCNPNESLEVLIKDEGDNLVFEIIDSATVFNIADYSVPSMDKVVKEKKNGNIGLILVKKIMDTIQIDSKNNLSVCRMIKKVSLANANQR